MKRVGVVVAFLGCASAPGPAAPGPAASGGEDARLASLEASVEELRGRLAELENGPTGASAEAPDGWSCAAQCVTAYHCREEGDSNVDYRDVYGKGPLAVDAFRDIQTECGGDDLLVVQGVCEGGVFEQKEASITNACVKN